MDDVKIRLAKESDKKYLQTWLNDKDILKWFPMCNEMEVEDSVNIWMSYIKYDSVLVAEINGTPVGNAMLYIQHYNKLKHQALFAIVVDQNYRGKKIGSKLLNELFKRAKEKLKLEMIHLEVYHSNPAINLYKRLGFKQYGVHKKFLKDLDGKYYDKILMQKVL
jgi:putative acetyltransferase